mgnify:CR=1 FL=1
MEKLVEQIKSVGSTEFSDYWPEDWVLRLLALFFAIFLWYFVVGEDKVDTHLLVPVELVNLPRDLVIANQVKSQLEVTISGPRGLIDGLRRQPVTRSINLAGAKPGTMVIPNQPEDLPFPRGIEVLRVQPAHTSLLIDRLKEKNLPIQADTSGEPAKGYELVRLELSPPNIMVRGPEALLNRVNLLRTMPIDLSGLNNSVSRQVPLMLDQELLELLGEVTINVQAEIREKTGEIEIKNLKPTLSGAREEFLYTLAPKVLKVRVKAPLSLHKTPEIIARSLEFDIDLALLLPGSHELVPTVVAADEKIKVVAVAPEKIKVSVKKKADPEKVDPQK